MSEEDEKEKREQEEKIRELEEKIRRLEQERGEEPESVAGNILEGLGGMLPGLRGLLKGLEKSDAFRERLKAIDEEIEVRLREEPLKRTNEEGRRIGHRAPTRLSKRPPMGRPPHAKRTATPVRRKVPVTVEEPFVDLFDEEDHLKVVAELPGIEERDIKVDLSGAQLIISADTPARKYRKELILPSMPKGEIEKIYRNGILEITLRKE